MDRWMVGCMGDGTPSGQCKHLEIVEQKGKEWRERDMEEKLE